MIIEERRILKHVKNVTGIIHIGAHEAQELEFYRQNWADVDIFWFEADFEIIPRLLMAVAGDEKSTVVCAALSDTTGEAMFHRTNMDQSSSLLELGTHATVHPEVKVVNSFPVTTTLLDDWVKDNIKMAGCNFMNIDVQGAEGMVLRGSVEHLNFVDFLYLEANKDELYKGCMQLEEMDEFLRVRDFERRETLIYENLGWGDVLYCKQGK